ncbi:hypothetical protein [Candidatus Nitrotoga sp. M5]|uniref:hypothetical protein n=1 Tax=Candidatus Nitrotoga sp. M5 TaxID=2890409 RepID=UPI001EF2863D|nr:hypothetical protein [Candidatus Nitrotoga sp. M5]CAH1385686.1 hypothetical protein NTGM5_150003 [Candidatus Nitrotoga sp. M5]
MTEENDFDTITNEQFVLKGRLTADDLYVDGLSQITFGFPVTKLLFHTIIETRSAINLEKRIARQYMTIPTVAAIELAHLILTIAKKSEAQLMKDLNEGGKEKVEKLLNDFHYTVSRKGVEEENKVKIATAKTKKAKFIQAE